MIAILIASVIGGVIGAYFTNQIYAEKADELYYQAINDYLGYPQGEIAVHTVTIRAAEAGDTDALLRINCILLRTKIRHLHPDLENNLENREQVEKVKTEAQQMVARLDERELCSF